MNPKVFLRHLALAYRNEKERLIYLPGKRPVRQANSALRAELQAKVAFLDRQYSEYLRSSDDENSRIISSRIQELKKKLDVSSH